jgi:electron transport complex protein RnfG
MSEYRQTILKSSTRLGVIAFAAVGLLSAIFAVTEERIREQERRAQLRVLQEVLPTHMYDNDLLADRTLVIDQALLGNALPKAAYRGRLGGRPSVLALEVTAARGYNGNIDLIVGIQLDGTLSGVRVVRHKETPGLGDGIDTQVSDWILQFTGLSLDSPAEERWAVKRDDGDFDQFTGATITPRAVVTAARDALVFYRHNRDQLFKAESVESE